MLRQTLARSLQPLQKQRPGVLLQGANLCLAQPSVFITGPPPHKPERLLHAMHRLCTAQRAGVIVQANSKAKQGFTCSGHDTLASSPYAGSTRDFRLLTSTVSL